MSETKRMFAYLLGGLALAVALMLAVEEVGRLENDTVVLVLIIVSWAAVSLYFPLYSTRRWWDTGPGRALWVKSLGNFIVINMAMLVTVFGEDYPFREQVRTTGFTLFAIGMIYLLVTLMRAPRRTHDLVAPEQSGWQNPPEEDPPIPSQRTA